MRTIETTVYKFDELTETAKQKAIEKYRDSNNHEYFWQDENRKSMEVFGEIFPIKTTNWSYAGRGEGVFFSFETDRDEIEGLSGQRLARYIWNNYRSQIYSKKYFSLWSKTETSFKHHTEGFPVLKSRYSKILLEKYNCPLTGYCMDNELLDGIWKFLDKPDSRDFKQLLKDCFDSWINACNEDCESQDSDEYITEQLEANEYEFDEDGNLI